MNIKQYLIFILAFCSLSAAFAQGFTETFTGQLDGVNEGDVAWGDYDGDGDLDVLITGTSNGSSSGVISKIYQNTGSGFTEVFAGQLEGVYRSSVDWGDYDNDGDLDVLITGTSNGSSSGAISKIYQNTGSGFVEVFAGQLDGVYYSSVDWGDYDSDGDLDILISGNNSSSIRISKIYENTGTGFTEVYAGQLDGVYFSSVEWGDYDGDGDLDILISGTSNGSSSGRMSKIYQNTGSGFTEVYAGQIDGVFISSVDWGDYDGDGDFDILISGTSNGSSSGRMSKIFQNTGTGFVEVFAGQLDAVYRSSVDWGDYDNDGDLDILITGTSNGSTSGAISKIYQNTGSGFSEVFTGQLDGVYTSSVDWGDYDNDGDLDVLIAGLSANNTRISKIYQNTGTNANTAPTSPSSPVANVTISQGLGRVALSWVRSTDGQTPTNGLSYEVRIGTESGGSDIASVPFATAEGYPGLPEAGRIHTNNWSAILNNGTYYWSVRAVDAGFMRSPFSPEQTFTVAVNAPTTAPSLSLVADKGDSLDFTWTSVSNINRYELELSGNASFSAGESGYQRKTIALGNNATTVEVESESDIFFSRVSAVNAGGSTLSSTIRLRDTLVVSGASVYEGFQGERIKLLGEGFAAEVADNVVRFGSDTAMLVSLNDQRTELTLEVPQLSASNSTIRVSAYQYESVLATRFIRADLPKPQNVTATASGNTVTLSWDAISDTTQYIVARGNSVASITNIDTVSTSTFTDDGLTTGQTYYYHVISYDEAIGSSTASETVEVLVQNTTATQVVGNFSDAQTWTRANSPYEIIGDVNILEGGSLTIESGVEVRYVTESQINILGSLSIDGSENLKVKLIKTLSYNEDTSKPLIKFRGVDLSASSISGLTTDTDHVILQLGEADGSGTAQNSDTLQIIHVDLANGKINMNDPSATTLIQIRESELVNIEALADPDFRTSSTEGIDISNSEIRNSFLQMPVLIVNNVSFSNVRILAMPTGTKHHYTGSDFVNSSLNHSYGTMSSPNVNGTDYQMLDNRFLNTYLFIRDPKIQRNRFEYEPRLDTANRVDGISGPYTAFVNLTVTSGEGNLSNNLFDGKLTVNGIEYFRASAGTFTISGNTFYRLDRAIELLYESQAISDNNFIGNNYALVIEDDISRSIGANYYDGLSTPDALIFDQLDDIDLGRLTYGSPLLALNAGAPIVPPTGVVKAANGANVNISWTASPSTSVAGYLLSYGEWNGHLFANTVDIGNVTTYSLTDYSIDQPLAIQAYSGTYAPLSSDNYVQSSSYVYALGAPDQPTGLVARGTGTSSASIGWEGGENALIYEIDLSYFSDFRSIAKTYQSGVDTLNINDLNPAPYYVRVRAGNGQTFSEYSEVVYFLTFLYQINQAISIEDLNGTGSSWVDFNGDGLLDLFHTGGTGGVSTCKLYLNSSGSYVEVYSNQIHGVSEASFSWGDYDRDGDMDLAISGWDGSRDTTTIYTNTGSGFVAIEGLELSGGNSGEMQWVDYDNDGDLDLHMVGSLSHNMYINVDTTFIRDDSFRITGLLDAAADWGDVDNDGDLDLLLVGQSSDSSSYLTMLYQNNGGEMVYSSKLQAEGLRYAAAKWADFDNDGLLDFAVAGRNNNGENDFGIYQNTPNGFTKVFEGDIVGLEYASIDWADYDGDGLTDLMVSGDVNFSPFEASYLYRNTGSGFDLNLSFGDYTDGSLDFGDYDNDGDLDLLQTGSLGSDRVVDNITTKSNGAPGQVIATTQVQGSQVSFSWDAPADDTTPALVLSYNLYIGTSSGSQDIKSGMANLSTGRRLVPEPGTIRGDNYKISLPAGTYFWGMQAIDAGLAAGAFSTEQSFVIEDTAFVALDLDSLIFPTMASSLTSTRKVRLTSTGAEEAQITSISFAEGTVFSVDQSALTLASGVSDTLTITFDPLDGIDSVYTDTLKFVGDFEGRKLLIVRGGAEGVSFASFEFASDSLNWRITETLDRSSYVESKEIKLYNRGNLPLTLNLDILNNDGCRFRGVDIDSGDALCTELNEIQLEVGDSTVLKIFLAILDYGSYQAVIKDSSFPEDSLILNALAINILAPEAPTGLSVTDVAFDSAAFSWNATDSTDEYLLDVYENASFSSGSGFRVSVSGTDTVLTGLNDRTNYYTRVLASFEGNESTPSETVSFTTPPEFPFEPLSFNVSGIDSSSFNVSWSVFTQVPTYEVVLSQSGSVIETDIVTVLNKSFNRLNDSTEYTVEVAALLGDTAKSEYLTRNVTTLVGAPERVSGLEADVSQIGQIATSWNDLPANKGIISYNLELLRNGSVINTASVGQGIQEYVFSNVSVGDYEIAISATNRIKEGPEDIITVSTLADNEAPVITLLSGLPEIVSSEADVTPFFSITDNSLSTLEIVMILETVGSSTQTELSVIDEGNFEYSTTFQSASTNAFQRIAISVTDGAENTTDTTFYMEVRVASQTRVNSIARMEAGTSASAYQIISLPYSSVNVTSVLDVVTKTEVVVPDFIENNNWSLYSYENNTYQEYSFQGPSFSRFEAGKGYFYIQREAGTLTARISTSGPEVKMPEGYFELRLVNGWNLIGNPFRNGLDWNQVLSDNISDGTITANQISEIVQYEGGYVRNDQILDPFEGAFIDVSRATTLRLYVSSLQGGNGSRVSSSHNEFPSSGLGMNEDWHVNFSVSAKGFKNGLGGFGQNAQATRGLDNTDTKEPDMFSEYISVESSKTVSVAGDNVAFSDSTVWEFQISTHLPEGTQMEIEFLAIPTFINGDELMLFDRETGFFKKLTSTNKSYSLIYSKGYTLQIVKASPAELAMNYLPEETILGNIYPNPFNRELDSELTIPVTLNAGFDITVASTTVYDLTGRVVQGIKSETIESGRSQIGIRIPGSVTPGTYYITIELVSGYENRTITRKVFIK